MGTGVTIDIPEASSEEAFNLAFGRLRAIDVRFSTYKKDSEVSCFARGELAETDLSDELKKVVAACRQAEAGTGGYFSAWYKGVFEPSGYVKGWAIAEAGKLIERAGFNNYCLSIGGDILARGDKTWRVGIQDPEDKTKILKVIGICDGAICTSGNYARGAHIIDPATGRPADRLRSVSVVGPDIIQADILATAAFVAGEDTLDFIKMRAPGYETLVVHRDGRQTASTGFAAYLA